MTRHSNHPKVYLACMDNSTFSVGGTRFMKACDNNVLFTATKGYPAGREASITALHCMVSVTAWTSAATVTLDILVNNAIVFSATSASIGATGEFYFQALQRPGIDKVAFPDFITMQQTIGAAPFDTQDVLAIIELELDT